MSGSPTIRQSALELAGVATRVLEVDGAGPAVLLLHGFSDSADGWRPVLTELARHGRRAVAVDLPGAGWAEPLGRPALPVLDRVVGAFAARYADMPVLLVGNSLGGLLALRAGGRPGPALAGIVAMDPAGLAYAPSLRLLSRLIGPATAPVQSLLRLPIPGGLVRLYARIVFEIALSQGRAGGEAGRIYASHVHDRRGLLRLWDDLRALNEEGREVVDVAAIRVPVLLIWGALDCITPVDAAGRMLAVVPDSRLAVLSDCGHCPQLQRPIQVADLIASFAEPFDTADHRTPGTSGSPDHPRENR